MRWRARAGFFLAGAALLFSFNNCAQTDLNSQADLLSEGPGRDLGPSNQWCKAGRKASDGETQKLAADLMGLTLTSSTPLLILVNNRCLQEKGSPSWLSSLAVNSVAQLSDGETTTVAIRLSNPTMGSDLARVADADPCVERVDLNAKMQMMALPNDPYYSVQQPYLRSVMHDRVVENLYNAANGVNQTIRVAVLDSGFDVNHPDLASLFVKDSAGRIQGLNAIDNTADVLDTGFHGTHVLGLIAAVGNNGIGMSGVMGHNVEVLPIKVSTDGSSVDMSAVINGIRWAADNGAHVINMSLGGPQDRPALREALEYAVERGVFIAVASGNNGKTLTPTFTIYPAMYAKDIRGMIAVGSYDSATNGISGFSNVSSDYVDLLAPGSNGANGILSTVPANLSSTGYARLIGTNPIEGTSMATPIASGAAAMAVALARSRGYDALPDQIETLFDLGSTKISAYSTAAKNGNKLDLKRMTDTIDSASGLNLAGSQDRSLAQGSVSLATQPMGTEVPLAATFQLNVVASASSSPLLNYRWYRNGRLIAGSRLPTLTIKNASPIHSGVYYVEVSAGRTLIRSQSATVQVGNQTCL